LRNSWNEGHFLTKRCERKGILEKKIRPDPRKPLTGRENVKIRRGNWQQGQNAKKKEEKEKRRWKGGKGRGRKGGMEVGCRRKEGR